MMAVACRHVGDCGPSCHNYQGPPTKVTFYFDNGRKAREFLAWFERITPPAYRNEPDVEVVTLNEPSDDGCGDPECDGEGIRCAGAPPKEPSKEPRYCYQEPVVGGDSVNTDEPREVEHQ